MIVHELARRSEAGLLVRLLWDAGRNQAFLRYRDEREADAFVVDVPNASALDAFYHPNRYRPASVAAAA
jgi:hypothetical protein